MSDRPSHNESSEQLETSVPQKKTVKQAVVEYAKVILITLFAALLLKMLVVEAYRIPSTSMENTLQIGDFVLVNKLAYGLRSPRYLPFTTAAIPSFTIPLFKKVHRQDVIVFEFPGNRDEVKPEDAVNYIKRCIGLPGDTIEIRLGSVFVNGIELPFSPLSKRPNHPSGSSLHQSAKIFPPGTTYTDVNYGPIIVPKRNDTITLNANTIDRWRTLIAREGHHVSTLPDNSIVVDDSVAKNYRVQQDYYFVLGDNRDNSMDSRFWGFVPDDHLIGEALMIYWSWDPELSISSFFEKSSTIRWTRIGTLIR